MWGCREVSLCWEGPALQGGTVPAERGVFIYYLCREGLSQEAGVGTGGGGAGGGSRQGVLASELTCIRWLREERWGGLGVSQDV